MRAAQKPRPRDVDIMSMEFGDGENSEHDAEENGEVELTDSDDE